MAKLPSFQFYPGDWWKDSNLRRCSPAARGIWIDMICLMFECDERGVLASGGSPWTLEDIADAVGGAPDVALSCIKELVRKGVARRRSDGALFCARLVRDEEERRQGRGRVREFRKRKRNDDVTQKKRPCTEDEGEEEDSSRSGGSVRGVGDWLGELWSKTPERGRRRSSMKQVRAAWAETRPKPKPADVIAALEAFCGTDDWKRDGGRYVPALHRWLANGKWKEPPETTEPKTGVAALTDEQRQSLWAYVREREPSASAMSSPCDHDFPLMRKHIQAWGKTA